MTDINYDALYREHIHYSNVRAETYGFDSEQSGWLTLEERENIAAFLNPSINDDLLEIGSGCGDIALFFSKKYHCRVIAVDKSPFGVSRGREKVAIQGLSHLVDFESLELHSELPFPDHTFSCIVSVDVFCHIDNRPNLLRECWRLLRPDGKLFFTDSMIITGIISNADLQTRSSFGYYEFTTEHANTSLILDAGFEIANVIDSTANVTRLSHRWRQARERYKEEIEKIEGEEAFSRFQEYLRVTHFLALEERLRRNSYYCVKTS
jgi:SAM-dependent methyltransferase